MTEDLPIEQLDCTIVKVLLAIRKYMGHARFVFEASECDCDWLFFED